MSEDSTGSTVSSADVVRSATGRRGARIAFAVVLVTVGTVALAWPWLTAPLGADERYQYLAVPAYTDSSWTGVVERIWREIPQRADTGRITPIGYLMQHLSFLAVFKASTATGTSVVVGHALVKLAMVGLAVAAFWWFLRSVRVRGTELASRHAGVLAGLFAVLLLVGGQTQVLDRSSWTAYPVLTTGAIAVAFGTVALCLRLADRLTRSTRWLLAVVPVLLALAVFLNLSYELYYVAVPLTVLVLLVHTPPARPGGASWLQRHSRLVVGGGLAVLFGIGLVWVRRTVAAICAAPDAECYVGTEASLGGETVVVAWRNLLGAVPLFAGGPVGEFRVERTPWIGAPSVFGGYGWLAAVLVVVGLVLLLRVGQRGATVGGGSDDVGEGDLARSLRPVLTVVALTGLALAGGSAVIMALSAQAPEIVTQLGIPYRSTTVTWAGLCVAGLGLVALLATGRGPRQAVTLPVLAVSAVVLVIGIAVWPIMAQAVRSVQSSPGTATVSAIHRAVLTPVFSERGDAQRCQLLDDLGRTVPGGTAGRLEAGALGAFEDLWDEPFCASEAEEG